MALRRSCIQTREFRGLYPFIPYQFNLAWTGAYFGRTHGASGNIWLRESRSMLALFKSLQLEVMDDEMVYWLPFNMFYDALTQVS